MANVINVLDTDTLVAGTSGADSIDGYAGTINAGTGNDTINLSNSYGSEKILYTNGDGNDIIINSGAWMPTRIDRLALAEGTSISSYSVSGKDHIFKIGSGSVTFKNADDIWGNKARFIIPTFSTVAADNEIGYEYQFTYDNKIYLGGKIFNYNTTYNSDYNEWDYKNIGTAEADYIGWGFDGNSTIVDGGAGDDYISFSSGETFSYGDNTDTILGGAGNDTLLSDYATSHAIVDGGTGNDLIQIVGGISTNEDYMYADVESLSSRTLIRGGEGNDVIETQAYTREGMNDTYINDEYEYGHKMTINGGTGNDTIRNTFINRPTNDTIKYTDSDGTQVTVHSYLDSKAGNYFDHSRRKICKAQFLIDNLEIKI